MLHGIRVYLYSTDSPDVRKGCERRKDMEIEFLCINYYVAPTLVDIYNKGNPRSFTCTLKSCRMTGFSLRSRASCSMKWIYVFCHLDKLARKMTFKIIQGYRIEFNCL